VQRRRFLLPLTGYLAAVCVIGGPVIGFSVQSINFASLRDRPWLYVALITVLIIGEMMPIPVPRGDDAGDEVSISSTIALAIVMLASPGVAIVGQAIALAADEARQLRQWSRLAFNIAQYSLALETAWVVYSWLIGVPFGTQPLRPPAVAVGAGLVAAAAFFFVNNTLTGIAIALKLRTPVRRQLVNDFRYQLTTSGVLLALAPVTALTVNVSAWTLPLLLVPIAAVHRSARLAYAREHEALHDGLTGLANRALFSDRVERACADANRHPAAVMIIDVDHFKEINDTLGHHAGDLLLIELAARLRGAVREGNLVARLGGDEFAVLAPGIATEQQARPLLKRLETALQGSVLINGVRVDISASVGVALTPLDAGVAEQLLQRADVAMYAAKRNRGSVTFYESNDDIHTVERLSLLGELRDALDAGDVFLAYQPKISLIDDSVVGIEALARWNHPTLGVLGPARFIPLAENTGLIDALTLRLLEEGLCQLGEWHRQGHDLGLAVNLSARVLTRTGLAGHVERLLREHNIAPECLTLEITESMIVLDTSRVLTVLRGLRDIGVRISIDDFGTGYSSLAYLKRLAVDELKIDRGFISRIADDRHDAVIAEMTIELGHHFDLLVVAEGVEDERALQTLRQLGCDVVQGFHIAPPLPAAELTDWMATRPDLNAVREAIEAI
jgi:diguanylate cyclase (GGDEF)-like protein